MTPIAIALEVFSSVAVIAIFTLICWRIEAFRKTSEGLLGMDVIGLSLLTLCLLFAAQVAITNFLHSQNRINDNTYCSLGSLIGIIIYCACKLLIYLYLIEKVYHISKVFTPRSSQRWRSRQYLLSVASFIPLIFTSVWLVLNRVYHVDSNGGCHIGVRARATIPMWACNSFFSFVMIIQFMRPLLQYSGDSSMVQSLAKKNFIGAVICLSTSFATFMMNALMNGSQSDYMSNFWGIFDVTLDAVVINWLLVRTKRTIDKEVSEVVMTVREDAVVNVIIDDKPTVVAGPVSSVPSICSPSCSQKTSTQGSPDTPVQVPSPPMPIYMKPWFTHEQSTSINPFLASFRNTNSMTPPRVYSQFRTSTPNSTNSATSLASTPDDNMTLNNLGNRNTGPPFQQWQTGTPPLAPTSRSNSTFRSTCSDSGVAPSFDQWQSVVQPPHTGQRGTPPHPPTSKSNTSSGNRGGGSSGVAPSFNQWQSVVQPPHTGQRGTPPHPPTSKSNTSSGNRGGGSSGVAPSFDQWQSAVQPPQTGQHGTPPHPPTSKSNTSSGNRGGGSSGVAPSFDQWQSAVQPPQTGQHGTPPHPPTSKSNTSSGNRGGGSSGVAPSFDQWQSAVQPPQTGQHGTPPHPPTSKSNTSSGNRGGGSSGVAPSFDQWQSAVQPPHTGQRGTPPHPPTSKSNTSSGNRGGGSSGVAPSFDQWQSAVQPPHTGQRGTPPHPPTSKSNTSSGNRGGGSSGVAPSFDQWQSAVQPPQTGQHGTPPHPPTSKSNTSSGNRGGGSSGVAPSFDQWQIATNLSQTGNHDPPTLPPSNKSSI